MKTCYYELLEVEQTCSDSQLKKAYRKQALIYHPDKNPDDPEAATKKFAQIRLAYEVLSDPQERAWYDAHRSQILREDGDGRSGGDFDEDDIEPEIAGTTAHEIMKYFDPSLYSRVDDTEYGFYAVAGNLFNQLAKEEILAGRQQGLDGYSKFQDDDFEDTTNIKYPKFGNSKSDYAEQVRKFYQVWSSFTTVKTFSWRDEYRYSSAGDRRTRRTMERENKKARDNARREYNETVKRFVAFIKKRDQRVKEGASKFEQERKKKQQEELRRQIEKDRAAHNERIGQFQEQNWQTINDDEFQELEKHFVSDSDHDSSSDDDLQIFECVICEKVFKTNNQYQAHEQSSKHKKLLAKIKWEMRQEGIILGIDKVSDESDFDTADEEESENETGSDEDDDDDFDDVDEELKKIEEELNRLNGKVSDIDDNDDDDDVGSKGQDSSKLTDEVEVDDIIDTDFQSSEEEIQISKKKLSKKEKKKQKYTKQVNFDKNEDDTHSKVDELSELAAALEKGVAIGDAIVSDDDDDWKSNKKTKKKKPKKSNDLNSASATPPPTVESTKKDIDATTSEVCSVCKTSFPSRNKLFQHVKATGHALAPPPSKKKNNNKKKK